jgi:hypothetical protein
VEEVFFFFFFVLFFSPGRWEKDEENEKEKEGPLCRSRSGMAACRGDREEVLDELVEPGAGNDHRVAASVGFFADAKEATAGIFAVINDQELAFHLELAGRDNLTFNHVGALWGKEPRLMPQPCRAGKGDFSSRALLRSPCMVAAAI